MIKTYHSHSQPRINPITISTPLFNIGNRNRDTYYNLDTINNPLGTQIRNKVSNTKNSKGDTHSHYSDCNRDYSLAIIKSKKQKNHEKNKQSKCKKKSDRKEQSSLRRKLLTNDLGKHKYKKSTNFNNKLCKEISQKLILKNLHQIESSYKSIDSKQNRLKSRNKRSQTLISKNMHSQTRNQQNDNSQFLNQPLSMRSSLPIFVKLGKFEPFYLKQIRMVSQQ